MPAVNGRSEFRQIPFISIQDRKGKIQGYVGKQNVGDEAYALFKKFDIGDIVYTTGRIFRTKTGELTVERKKFHSSPRPFSPFRKMAWVDGCGYATVNATSI